MTGQPASPWPHRMAWVLCCATFPLLWVGGLITTTDAGMAVPDWPGTYGYNLFLYPWRTWLFGPWDLLVEHGHRLFASGVGLLTIAMVVVAWRSRASAAGRWLSVAALGLVVLQGVLGGLRVVLNERHLALLHGATGPVFFAVTAVLVVLTRGRDPQRPGQASRPSGLAVALACVLPVSIYFQLVLGAAMRHVPEDSSYNTFAQHVQTHVWGAGVVTLGVLLNASIAWLGPGGRLRRTLATLMIAVVLLQGSLGVATWVAKYRLPGWAQTGVAADAWAAVAGPGTMSPSSAGGWIETHVVTGHSATGSLLLALSVAHAVVATRRRAAADQPEPPVPPSEPSPPRRDRPEPAAGPA